MTTPRRASPRPRGIVAEPLLLSWDEFMDGFALRYRQDHHVTLLGPTEVGKTTLALELLELRESVLAIATKPEDPIVERFTDYGYRVQEHLEIPTVEDTRGRKVPEASYRRIVLWPRSERTQTNGWRSIEQVKAYQRREIVRAFDYTRRARRWTVFADDVMYLAEDLKLDAYLKWLWRQGRTAGLGLVTAAQRPAWVPRDAYSQAQHLFFWRTNDRNDLERLSDIGGGFDRRELEEIISQLPRFEFLYIAPREHPPTLAISKVVL